MCAREDNLDNTEEMLLYCKYRQSENEENPSGIPNMDSSGNITQMHTGGAE